MASFNAVSQSTCLLCTYSVPDTRGNMTKMPKKTLWLIPWEGDRQVDKQLGWGDKYSVVVHLGPLKEISPRVGEVRKDFMGEAMSLEKKE